MSNHRLSIWKIFGNALMAPFRLESASWKALAKPGLALALSCLFPLLINILEWRWTLSFLFLLPIWVAIVWCAAEFQRQLLLGAEVSESEPTPWRRYGLYLLILVVLCVLLALLISLLLRLILPAMVFFLMALNSPQPLLAAGVFVLGILVVGIAAYPVVRLALMLPALTVGHNLSPGRIWRLSRHNGLRLLMLLIMIPGLFNVVLYFAFDAVNDSLLVDILRGLLNAYFILLLLSQLALAYRTLSDQPLPAIERIQTERRHPLNTHFIRPAVFILLAGVGGILAWDAVYRVEKGETATVFRLGKPVRVEPKSGVHIKIPLLEDTQMFSTTTTYHREGKGRFYTLSKDVLPLNYAIHWRVADSEVYARSTSGQSRIVDMRIDRLLIDILRHRVAKVGLDDIQRLVNAGAVEFSISEESSQDALFDGMLENLNARVMELGIEITACRIETDS